MRVLLLTVTLLAAGCQCGYRPVVECEPAGCPTDGGGGAGGGVGGGAGGGGGTGVGGGADSDAGSDAGVALDGGSADAGVETDAGPVDSGISDAGHTRHDAGMCWVPPHTDAGELAKTPRANPYAEVLVIESTGQFVADDETYARVVLDLPRLAVIDGGTFPARFLPDFVPNVLMMFDDAGFIEVASGAYSAWDCLNRTYDGDIHVFSFRFAYVELHKVVDVRVLAAEYGALPHVTIAEPDSAIVFDTCGYDNDFCLDVDGGVFNYLGWVDKSDCARVWFRLTSQPDGGSSLEVRDAGLSGDDWMDELPGCASRLWGHPHRWPDGGFK